jgi:ankyrin repeat protein
MNATTKDGVTALHLAAMNGHLESVQALLFDASDSIDPNIKEKSTGKTAIHYAIQNRHEEIARLMCSLANPGGNQTKLVPGWNFPLEISDFTIRKIQESFKKNNIFEYQNRRIG